MNTNSGDARSLYLLDETAIEQEHDAAILADPVLQKHVKMINLNLDFIDQVLRAHTHSSTDELIVHRLTVRCFNSGAAALRLARMGYYNQCLSLIRDIMEVTLLLDLFRRDPATIKEWTTASADERNRKFGAYQVRMRLEEIEKKDGKTPLNRSQTYKRFCTYGTHASPESFVLISPNAMTQIGPFPDAGRLKAMIEEIVQHLTFATTVFIDHIESDDLNVLSLQAEFYDRAEDWANEFIRRKVPAHAK
jgi:hypothetical protein